MLTRKEENHQWRRSPVGHEYSWLVQQTDDDDSSGGDDDYDDEDDTTISFRHAKLFFFQLGFDKYIDPLKTYLSKYRDSVKGTTCIHIYLYLYLSVCLSNQESSDVLHHII